MTKSREREKLVHSAQLDGLEPLRSPGDAFLALSACFDALERTAQQERAYARALEALLLAVVGFAAVVAATSVVPGVPSVLSTGVRCAAAACVFWRAWAAAERRLDLSAAQEDEARITRRFGDDLRQVELSLERERAGARR